MFGPQVVDRRGRAPHQRTTVDQHKGGEPDRGYGREGDLPQVHLAPSETADDGQDEQAQDVIQDGSPQDDPAGREVEPALARQHPRRDPHARRHHCRADEQGRGLGRALAQHQAIAQQERQHDPAGRNDGGRLTDPHELGGVGLQPHGEEQEEDTQLGEGEGRLVRLDPPQHLRPDQHSRQDLADDRRLAQPLEQLRSQLRRDEDDQDLHQQVLDIVSGLWH